MADKKSFVMSNDNIEDFMELTDAQAGQLIKAIFAHENEVEYELSDPVVAAVFRPIRRKLDANREAYEDMVEKRREAGAKGGRPKKQTEAEEATAEEEKQAKAKKANAFSEKQTKAKKADTDTDTDTVTDLKEKEYTSYIPKRKVDFDQEFEELWKLYPRKEGKEGARKAYARYRKNDDSLFAKVKDGIERYSAKLRHDGTETQYTQMGSTWFNGKGWESEYALSTTVKNTAKIIPAPQRYESESRDLSFLEM